MADIDPRWQRVGKYIASRVAQLSLTQAEIAGAGGPTDKTLRGYIDGKPIVRADKRRELCRILGWQVESIDLILNGGEPVLTPPPPDRPTRTPVGTYPTDYNSRIARMPEHVEQAINDIIDAEERRQGLR